MALGMEVGLGPGHIVVDGNQLPSPKKAAEPPIFGPFLLSPNGWMHQGATWYGDRPWPRGLCVIWGPSSPPQKGQSPQNFRPMFIVVKRLWIKMARGMEVGITQATLC